MAQKNLKFFCFHSFVRKLNLKYSIKKIINHSHFKSKSLSPISGKKIWTPHPSTKCQSSPFYEGMRGEVAEFSVCCYTTYKESCTRIFLNFCQVLRHYQSPCSLGLIHLHDRNLWIYYSALQLSTAFTKAASNSAQKILRKAVISRRS